MNEYYNLKPKFGDRVDYVFSYYYPQFKQRYTLFHERVTKNIEEGSVFDEESCKIVLNNLLSLNDNTIHITKDELIKLIKSDNVKPLVRAESDFFVDNFPVFRVVRKPQNLYRDVTYFTPCTSLLNYEYGQYNFQIERIEVYYNNNPIIIENVKEAIKTINRYLEITDVYKYYEKYTLDSITFELYRKLVIRNNNGEVINRNLLIIEDYFNSINKVYPHTKEFLPNCEISHYICATYITLLTGKQQ